MSHILDGDLEGNNWRPTDNNAPLNSITNRQTNSETELANSLEHFCRWRPRRTVEENIGSKYAAHFSSVGSRLGIKVLRLPFLTLLQNPVNQLVTFLGSLLLVVYSAKFLAGLNDYGAFSGSEFRVSQRISPFSPHEICKQDACSRIDIKLFHGHCLLVGERNFSTVDSSILIRFDSSVSANNIQTVGISSPFWLHAAIENTGWEIVASSSYRTTSNGIRFLDPEPDHPRSTSFVDHRPPWPLVLGAACHLLVGLGTLCIALCAMFKRTHLAEYLAALVSSIQFAAEAISAGGYFSCGLNREAFHASGQGPAGCNLDTQRCAFEIYFSGTCGNLLWCVSRLQ